MRVLLALCLLVCGFVANAVAQRLEPLETGNTIQISIWQDPKLDRTVVIGPDGMISFPLAGHIRAAGLTTRALEDILRSRLAKNYTGQLDVTVALAPTSYKEDDFEHKPKVYISGEVLKPGPYSVKTRVNVAQAIGLAGGLSPFAAAQRIQIHRQVNGVDSIVLFDYRAYQAGTGPTENIPLRSGDVVIVPERGLFE